MTIKKEKTNKNKTEFVAKHEELFFNVTDFAKLSLSEENTGLFKDEEERLYVKTLYLSLKEGQSLFKNKEGVWVIE